MTEQDKELNPLKELEAQVTEDKKEPEVNLQKGFIIGLTEDNFVKLRPFGGLTQLEMVALGDYVKLKADETLNYMGKAKITEIDDIKNALTIVALGVNKLLKKDEEVKDDTRTGTTISNS